MTYSKTLLIYRIHKIFSNFTVHRQIYEEARNHEKKLTESAKTQYYNNLVINGNKNQKALFKIVQNLTQSDSSSVLPDAKNDQELAESFSDFFTSIL